MFKIRLRASRLTLKRGFTEACHERVRTQLKQAAKEFVKEAIKHIPIDTGQAMGTILPLGRFLNISVSTSGNKPLKNKNPETGANGQNKLIFKFESLKTGEKFEIDVQLLYFFINDFFGHPSGKYEPWYAIDAGWTAFRQYLAETAKDRYPKLKDFIEYHTQRIEFNG